MTILQLNTASFSARIPFSKSLKAGFEQSGVFVVLIIFIIFIPVLVFSGKVFAVALGLPDLVVILAAFLLTAILSSLLFIHTGKKHLIITQFASDNALIYYKNISPDNNLNFLDKNYPSNSLLFGEGSSRQFTNLITKDAWYIGNYQYTTGSGKSRQTHRFGIVAMRLGKNLPHTVFDSKKNDFLFSNLPTWFDSSQKISLEGNFDDYFQAYMPDNYHIDVMSYITPEIMQLLIQIADQYDIEIVDDMLYIYKSGVISYQNDSNRFLSTISKLSDELVQNSETYRDQRASATASPETHQVATAGKRLKQRNFALLGLLPVGLFFVSSITSTSQYMMFTPLVVTVVVFVLVFIKRGR